MDGSFMFSCRTAPFDLYSRPGAVPGAGRLNSTRDHSYPPSPASSPRGSISSSSTITLVQDDVPVSRDPNAPSGSTAASSSRPASLQATNQRPSNRPPQPTFLGYPPPLPQPCTPRASVRSRRTRRQPSAAYCVIPHIAPFVRQLNSSSCIFGNRAS